MPSKINQKQWGVPRLWSLRLCSWRSFVTFRKNGQTYLFLGGSREGMGMVKEFFKDFFFCQLCLCFFFLLVAMWCFFWVCFWRICVNVLRFWMVQLKCRMSDCLQSARSLASFSGRSVLTHDFLATVLTPRWSSTCEVFLWGFLEALYSKLLDEYGYFWVLLHGNLGMQKISLFHVEDLIRFIQID